LNESSYFFSLNYLNPVAGLQSFPGYLKYKDAAAMLVEQTREANEKKLCFVIWAPTWPL